MQPRLWSGSLDKDTSCLSSISVIPGALWAQPLGACNTLSNLNLLRGMSVHFTLTNGKYNLICFCLSFPAPNPTEVSAMILPVVYTSLLCGMVRFNH